MPIFKRIKSFFKNFYAPEKIIDPERHHKEHEKFYNIAKGIQKEWDFDKKTAIKYTKKILKIPRAEISDVDKRIIEAFSP